jgi:hypothetical protein
VESWAVSAFFPYPRWACTCKRSISIPRNTHVSSALQPEILWVDNRAVSLSRIDMCHKLWQPGVFAAVSAGDLRMSFPFTP